MKKSAVLVVDDDAALRGMLSFSLEFTDYRVVEASSRHQAIDLLKKEPFPVVILDMGMPPHEHTPEEGIAVLNWLFENQPQVKVIVLTGQDAEATSYEALKAGAFDFVEKPVSEALLIQSIQRAFLFYEQAVKQKEKERTQRIEIEAVLGEGVKPIRNQAEERLLRQVLADTEFNVHATARRLGIKRENVYYLIKKYQIVRQEKVNC